MADNNFNSLFNDYNSKDAREFRARRKAAREEALQRAREARLRAEEEAREARFREEQQAYEAALERFKNDGIARGNAKGFADYAVSTVDELKEACTHYRSCNEATKKGMPMRVCVVTTTPGLKEELQRDAVEQAFKKGYYCVIEDV